MEKNVLGTELKACCYAPKTGFYRDGFCKTGPEDVGTHVVCAIMTEDFLKFTKENGNDLSTPMPMYQFPRTTTWRQMVSMRFQMETGLQVGKCS